MAHDLRAQILQNANRQFQKQGLKFTMADIAGDLHVAKKTIYKIFPSKEALLLAMIDTGFAEIHQEKAKIIASDLDLAEKISRVIIAFPAQLMVLDFRRLDGLKEKYPAVARSLKRNLETNWEPTLQLIEEGVAQKKIRPVNVPVLRMMLTASFESFLSTDTLAKNGIAYQDALQAMMDIIMNGIEEEQ